MTCLSLIEEYTYIYFFLWRCGALVRTLCHDLLLLSCFPPCLSSVTSDQFPCQKPLIELFFLPFFLYLYISDPFDFLIVFPFHRLSCLNLHKSPWEFGPSFSFGFLGRRRNGTGKKLNNGERKDSYSKELRVRWTCVQMYPTLGCRFIGNVFLYVTCVRCACSKRDSKLGIHLKIVLIYCTPWP